MSSWVLTVTPGSRSARNETTLGTNEDLTSPSVRHRCWAPASKDDGIPGFSLKQSATMQDAVPLVKQKSPESPLKSLPKKALYSLAGGQGTQVQRLVSEVLKRTEQRMSKNSSLLQTHTLSQRTFSANRNEISSTFSQKCIFTFSFWPFR